MVINQVRAGSLCNQKHRYENVYDVMCPIQLKIIKIYVADPQKKETGDMEKKKQRMRVGGSIEQ